MTDDHLQLLFPSRVATGPAFNILLLLLLLVVGIYELCLTTVSLHVRPIGCLSSREVRSPSSLPVWPFWTWKNGNVRPIPLVAVKYSTSIVEIVRCARPASNV